MGQIFGGKLYIEPGSGVQIVTNAVATPNLLATGRVAVIGESDAGLTFQDSTIYSSSDPAFLRSTLRGGIAKRCIDYIFNPSPSSPGAQRVLFIRAQQATKASTAISTVNYITLTSVDKGAYLSDSVLGLGYKLAAGVIDTAKNILFLYLDGNLIWTSPEVSTFQNLLDAIEADTLASSYITGVITGTASTAIPVGARTSTLTIFAGGTSPSMTGSDIDAALLLLRTQDINIVFIASPTEANYLKGQSFAINTAEYPVLNVCGGAAAETVSQVETRALNLNSEVSVIAYPGIIMPKEDGTGNETLSPMYHAAMIAGLAAGLSPENSLSWKKLSVLGFELELSKSDREDLITKGVLYSRNVPGIGYAVNKGINTLQNNGSMIYKNTDGTATSPEISIIRIKHQIIRELIVNSAPLFVGGNTATVTKETVENFTKSYLQTRTSTQTQSNLLISWDSVSATLQTDAWFVSFNFKPTTPINFAFFLGAMLKP